MKKNIPIITLIIVLVLGITWTVVAQKPDLPPPPPLPDLNKTLAQPNATATPQPDEKRPDDIPAPSVTPIPFKEVIDKSADGTAQEDKSEYIVRRANGDYVQIWTSAETFEKQEGKTVEEILGLSKGDEIITAFPPLRLMQPPPMLEDK